MLFLYILQYLKKIYDAVTVNLILVLECRFMLCSMFGFEKRRRNKDFEPNSY